MVGDRRCWTLEGSDFQRSAVAIELLPTAQLRRSPRSPPLRPSGPLTVCPLPSVRDFILMRFNLLQRRVVWWPTKAGWALLLLLLACPMLLWAIYGERFLSVTNRQPADILIVEAWIASDGAHAAAAEFTSGKAPYQYIVAVGGLSGERWTKRRWSYVTAVERELRRQGVPAERIITAETADVENQRTQETARTALRAMVKHGLRPKAVNVFTRGAHARRSQMIFTQAFGTHTPVGVVCWSPDQPGVQEWWNSSDCASEFLKETVACGYEFVVHFVPGTVRTLFGMHARDAVQQP